MGERCEKRRSGVNFATISRASLIIRAFDTIGPGIGSIRGPSLVLVSAALRTRFRACAIRGGQGLGASPEEAVAAWLDLIRSRLPGSFRPIDWQRGVAGPDSKPEEYIEFPKDLKNKLITDPDEPTDGDAAEVVVTFHRYTPRDLWQKVEGAGYLISPCQASVDLCMLLEADAQAASAQPTEPQDAVPGEPATDDCLPLARTPEAKDDSDPEVADAQSRRVKLLSWEHLTLRTVKRGTPASVREQQSRAQCIHLRSSGFGTVEAQSARRRSHGRLSSCWGSRAPSRPTARAGRMPSLEPKSSAAS